MKCCSLKKKDLDFNYQRMSQKYYMFNGHNDVILKKVYIAYLPIEL